MKRLRVLLYSLILLLPLVNTCKKVEKVMSVSTGVVTNISTTTADVSGDILDLGDGVTQYGHCYATTPNTSVAGPKTELGTPVGIGGFTSSLTGLEPGTKYYVKAYCSRGKTTVYGSEINFTTATAALPEVTTTAISAITKTSASSGGTITDQGGTQVTARGVCWNVATAPVVTDNKTTNGTGIGAFTSTLSGLTAGTKYYVRAYATNAGGTAYGNQIEFLTESDLETLPTVITVAVTSVTDSTAISGGEVTNEGGTSVYQRGVCWSENVNPRIDNFYSMDGTGSGSYVSTLMNLIPGKQYHIRAYAISNAGTSYANNELTFTTCIEPLVTTNAISNLTNISATLNASINANNYSTEVTFEYGLTTGYGTIKSTTPGTVYGNTNVSVSAGIIGLTPNTMYHYRVKAVNCGGIIYGPDQTFTTPCTAPLIITNAVTNRGTTTATLNGTVNANNFSTAVSFEYGTTLSYGSTITANPTPVTGSNNTAISAGVINLSPNILYHYRAKAINCAGIYYGSDQTFTTLCTLPSATTNAATNVTDRSATLNGIVNANNFSTTVTFSYWKNISDVRSITATQSPVIGNTNTPVSAAVSGLITNSVYTFYVKTNNCGGQINGSSMTFTTPPVVGDLFQGGIVIHIFQSGEQGYINGEVHGIIASLNDEISPTVWGCYGTSISGADGTERGTGEQNTLDIVTGCTTAGIAAKVCYDKVSGGYNDWYLPSRNELQSIYATLYNTGIGVMANGYYWSSSETSNNTASTLDGGSGYLFSNDKRGMYYVRAVRTF